MPSKKTVVIGASPNESRYSNFACKMLNDAGFEFVPVGIRHGEILGKSILDLRHKPEISNVHTISLYIGPDKQPEWYEYLLGLNPSRIIFNPGTENAEFQLMAEQRGIHATNACNLVLISTGQF